jgi:hypothetical protein
VLPRSIVTITHDHMTTKAHPLPWVGKPYLH